MNKYEKLEVIGEGTFGEVFKCRHKESNELVAIKKFKEASEEDETAKKVTLREVKLLRALKHEHIVELKEAFRRKGVLYLVFEHMDQSVMDVLEAKPNGVGKDIVQVLTFQLLRALEHCHRHNVIHRDIKPENLLVNSSVDSLRLCDFGCARQIKADVPLTDYVATRWYRPPELLLSTVDYGKPVDMWGLGCIMGELTDGQPLFAGKSDIDQLCVIQKILGPLTSQQMERCLELSDFKGIQFPDVSQPVTLQKRYAGRMPEDHLLLLTQLLVMDADHRLSAKAALRSPCFKDMRAPHPDKPPPQQERVASGDTRHRAPRSEKPPLQPQQITNSGFENHNAKNMTPLSTGMPELSLPSKAAKPRRKSSGRDDEMPPLKASARAADGPTRANAALPQIGLGAAAGGPAEDRARRDKPPKEKGGGKKDFRISQDNFSFKKEPRTPEDSRLAGNFSMNDFQFPDGDTDYSTPQAQAVGAYRLPWENPGPSEDVPMAEFGTGGGTPTPIFGGGSSKGFFADARATGGAAGGPTAKNAKAPGPMAKWGNTGGEAQVAKWGNLGGVKNRWSGA